MKINKETFNKGITLIALVITIIVLLILAGVSIATLTGENGILTQSQEAKIQTKIAEEKEMLELHVLERKFDKQQMLKSLTEKYGEDKVQLNANGSTTVTLESGNRYVVTNENVIVLDEDITEPTAAQALYSQIDVTDYGDTIEYSAGGVTDWKIFYKDNNKVYIIMDGYLSNTNLPEVFLNKLSKIGTDILYWADENAFTSTNAKTDITPEIANKFYLSWLSKATDETAVYANAKVTGDFLNVTAWTSKFGYSSKGIEAIGGSTLEMWIASWNQKGEKFGTDKYAKLYTKCDSKGYYISNEEETTTFQYNVGKDTDGYKDTLYFPYAKEPKVGETNGYWLASPSAYGESRVMNVYCDAAISRIHYYYNDFAFRPVVCLPETVLGVESADGLNWLIQY